MSRKLGMFVCENLRNEVAAALESRGLGDVAVMTFPANCGRPDVKWSDLSANDAFRSGEFDRIELIGGCCLAGLPEPPKEMAKCRVSKPSQCFDLFIHGKILEPYLQEGAYLVTPGWLARWRHYVNEWGFSEEIAKQFFSETSSRVLLLDTAVDAEAPQHLKEFADFVGLRSEILPVGTDTFGLYVANLVLKWQLEARANESMNSLAEANRQSADYAMVFDMIGSLVRIMTEAEAAQALFDLFTMLFAPDRLVYIPLTDGVPGEAICRPASTPVGEVITERFVDWQEDYLLTESGNGFLLKIGHQDQTVGIIEVGGIAFPEFRDRYMNLAHTVVRVSGLAIANARAYERMKLYEEALENERERLAVTLRSIGDGVIATDVEGRVVMINQVAEELSGWTQEEAFGRSITEVFNIINEQTLEICENPVERVLEANTVIGLANHTALIARDGTHISIADSAAPIRDRQGRILGVVLVFRDVTQQKQAEDALQASEEKYRGLFENMREGVALHELVFSEEGEPEDYIIHDVNAAFQRIVGIDRETAVGRRATAVYGIDQAPYLDLYAEVASTGNPRTFEAYFEPMDKHFSVSVFSPREKQFATIFTDITERKQAEQERERLLHQLENERARFEAVLQQMPSGVVIAEAPSGRLILGNEQVERMWRHPFLPATEISQYVDYKSFHRDGRPYGADEKPLARSITKGEIVVLEEMNFERGDGSRGVMQVSSGPIRNRDGEIVAAVAVFQDITTERTAQQERDQLREEYVSMISHDLLNPLAGLMANADWLRRILAKKEMDDEVTLVETIRKSGGRMSDMIRDLAESARLEAGRMEMHRVPTNPLQMVSDMVARFGTMEERARIRIECPSMIPPVLADIRQIERVVVNLVSNALKYSPPGSPVTILLGTAETEAVISVIDQGAGIPPEDLPFIFERFYRAKTKTKVEGLGLGLYITRLIVEGHEGRIWVESQLGKGSGFHFTLPLA